MYRQFKVALEIPTFVSHNGQTADPRNPYAKAIKEVTATKKKTEADHEALSLIEFEAGLYLNKDRQVIIPGRLFEALIAEGARKSKEGKIALSSTFVDTDAVISYDGGPLTVEQLLESDAHRLAVSVRVKQSRVVRTRPIFKDVKAEFIVSLQTEVANAAQLQRWVTDGMNQIGLGDWRPRHGRGIVTEFVEIAQPLKAAA